VYTWGLLGEMFGTKLLYLLAEFFWYSHPQADHAGPPKNGYFDNSQPTDGREGCLVWNSQGEVPGNRRQET
jgi:hypothetical protein